MLNCPTSYTYELTSADSVTISFPVDGREATATDNDGEEPTITYSPSSIAVDASKVDELYRIDVRAEDQEGNRAECAFSVNIKAANCQDWALRAPRNGKKECVETSSGWDCTMSCNENTFFYDNPTQSTRTLSCSNGNPFPSGGTPDCVRKFTCTCSFLTFASPQTLLKEHTLMFFCVEY